MYRTKFLVLKHTVYALFLFLVYLLQITPRALTISGINPLMATAFAVVVACVEGEFIGGIYGGVAGILCDLSAHTYFGYNAIVLLILCTACGLLMVLLVKQNWLSVTLTGLAVLIIQTLLEFYFYYGLWGYESLGVLFTRHTLPTIAYSTIFIPMFYFLANWFKHRMDQLMVVPE